jgi:hypothetical protein
MGAACLLWQRPNRPDAKPVIHHHDEAAGQVGLDFAPPGSQEGDPLPLVPRLQTHKEQSAFSRDLAWGAGKCLGADSQERKTR